MLSACAGDANVSWQSCRQQALGFREGLRERHPPAFSLTSSPLVGKPPPWKQWYLHHTLSLGTSPVCWALSSVPGWAGHRSLHAVPPMLVETPSPRSQQADTSEILAAVSIRKNKWSRSTLQEMVELFLRWRGPWLQ